MQHQVAFAPVGQRCSYMIDGTRQCSLSALYNIDGLPYCHIHGPWLFSGDFATPEEAALPGQQVAVLVRRRGSRGRSASAFYETTAVLPTEAEIVRSTTGRRRSRGSSGVPVTELLPVEIPSPVRRTPPRSTPSAERLRGRVGTALTPRRIPLPESPMTPSRIPLPESPITQEEVAEFNVFAPPTAPSRTPSVTRSRSPSSTPRLIGSHYFSPSPVRAEQL
jgi:hypothetical protein